MPAAVRFDLLWGRNLLDQVFQHILDTQTALSAAAHGVSGVDSDNVLDFAATRSGSPAAGPSCSGQEHFQPLLDGGVTVGHRLGLDPLPGIHHQQRAFAHNERDTS